MSPKIQKTERKFFMANRFVLNETSYHGKGAIREIAPEPAAPKREKAEAPAQAESEEPETPKEPEAPAEEAEDEYEEPEAPEVDAAEALISPAETEEKPARARKGGKGK